MTIMRLFNVVLFALLAFPALSETLEPPSGQVLLTVTGNINAKNAADAAQFDRAMLEALDWQEVRTHTPFTEGEQVFAGPTLASLLKVLGVQGGVLLASAINDYTVQINAGDAEEHAVLLAMDHNGAVMRVRDKGPIWIVYPQTANQAENHGFDAEMIWQLDRIRVE